MMAHPSPVGLNGEFCLRTTKDMLRFMHMGKRYCPLLSTFNLENFTQYTEYVLFLLLALKGSYFLPTLN